MLVLRAAGRELERELGWGVARGLWEAHLQGLTRDEREALLDGPAAGARALFDPAAAGNPLFVRELLGALATGDAPDLDMQRLIRCPNPRVPVGDAIPRLHAPA